MTLVGLTKSFDGGVVTFERDLAINLARGDENYLSLLDAADAYAARNGLDLPEEPEARRILPNPDCVAHPILALDLAGAGVTSIVWATGYAVDYGWLKVDAFADNGKPQHQRGVSKEPGIYFLGCLAAARLQLHLGRVARRAAHRRPHRDPAHLPRLPRRIAAPLDRARGNRTAPRRTPTRSRTPIRSRSPTR